MKTQAGMAWLARSGIAAATLIFGGAAPAHARITRIEIARVESSPPCAPPPRAWSRRACCSRPTPMR